MNTQRSTAPDDLDFHTLFEQARPQLLAVARRVVRSAADAEDVVQQAFVNAIRAADKFEGRAEATSWMYRITYNTALMHLRKKRRKGADSLDAMVPSVAEHAVQKAAEPPPSADAQLDQMRLREVLAEAVGALSDTDQRIVILRLEQGWSTQQVADDVGLSPAAIKTRLHRARQVLQRQLTPTRALFAV